MRRRQLLAAAAIGAAAPGLAQAKSCPAGDPGMRFLIEQDKAGEFRWTLKAAGNGAVIATPGEGYSTRQECEAAVGRVKQCWAAKIVG